MPMRDKEADLEIQYIPLLVPQIFTTLCGFKSKYFKIFNPLIYLTIKILLITSNKISVEYLIQ